MHSSIIRVIDNLPVAIFPEELHCGGGAFGLHPCQIGQILRVGSQDVVEVEEVARLDRTGQVVYRYLVLLTYLH